MMGVMIRTIALTLGCVSVLSAPAAGGQTRAQERAPVIFLYNVLEERAREVVDFHTADPDCPRNVDVHALAIPVTDNNRLAGYGYVTPRLCLARGVRETRVRENLHHIVDALLRVAHEHPFVLDGEGGFDTLASHEHLFAAAEAVAGQGTVERMILLGGDIRLLR